MLHKKLVRALNIIVYIRDNPEVTSKQISEALHISHSLTKRSLVELSKCNILIGTFGVGGGYKLSRLRNLGNIRLQQLAHGIGVPDYHLIFNNTLGVIQLKDIIHRI